MKKIGPHIEKPPFALKTDSSLSYWLKTAGERYHVVWDFKNGMLRTYVNGKKVKEEEK